MTKKCIWQDTCSKFKSDYENETIHIYCEYFFNIEDDVLADEDSVSYYNNILTENQEEYDTLILENQENKEE